MANPNPSAKTRFQPGNKANPGGRPKGKSLTSQLRDALAAVDPATGKPAAAALVDVLVRLALEGDRQAIKDVFERVDGRVPDKVDDATAPQKPRLMPKMTDDRYPDDPDENPGGG